MANQYLVTLSMDAGEKCFGLRVMLDSMESAWKSCFHEWRVVVLTPQQFSDVRLRKLCSKFPISFVRVPSPQYDNIYCYKTVIRRFAQEHLRKDDLLIYLDYDHIVCAPIRLPPAADGVIFVSSEVERFTPLPSDTVAFYPHSNFPDLHYNTSLIYSTAETLIQGTEHWGGFADALLRAGGGRNTEETAFSLSAHAAGVRLQPISSTIQGNWANPRQAQIFHYGGVAEITTALKSELSQAFSGVRFPRGADLHLDSTESLRLAEIRRSIYQSANATPNPG